MAAPGMVLCPNCKLENRRGETRCAGCGNALPRFAGLPKIATPTLPPDATPMAAPRRDEETQQGDVAGAKLPPPPPAAAAPEPPRAELNAVAWLHCEPLPAIPLVPGQAVTIGRKSAQVLLPHTEVSRHHATIRVSPEGQVTISDEGSSNGTHVNGKRVTSQPLRVGDLVKIGPYAIDVWAVKELPAEDPDMTTSVPLATEATFSGKLGPVALSEVVEGIEARKRTGTLSVTDRQQRGRIRFEQGKVVEAEWGPLRADPAVAEMLRLSFGSFAFSLE